MNTRTSGESLQPAGVAVHRPLRILIADDDRDTVNTLAVLLRHEGHEVLGVHNGLEVLSSIREFEPDAVILDISMPDLSGYEVARIIREALGRRPRAPALIGISGVYVKTPDDLLARAVGFDHYVTKPYDVNEVLAQLNRLCRP